MMKHKSEKEPWLELTGRKDEFQKIVGLLVDFDERTGRFNNYPDPEGHYLRKACAVARSDGLGIFARKLDECVFYIVVRSESPAGRCATAWIHEDGIFAERKTAPHDHPVQRIVCMSDLLESAELAYVDEQDSCIRELLTASLDEASKNQEVQR